MKITNKRLFFITAAVITVLIIIVSIVIGYNVSKNKRNQEAEVQEKETVQEEQQEEVAEESPDIGDIEAVTTGAGAEAEISYTNLDALYFITSSEEDYLKQELEAYFKAMGMTPVTEVQILPDISTDDDIMYTFWALIDLDTLIRGIYNFNNNVYSFELETDTGIIDRYIDTNTPDGIDIGERGD